MSRERKNVSIHEEESLGKVFEPKLIKRLLVFIKPYWLLVSLSIFMLIIIAVLEQIGPYLTKVAIDTHIKQKDFNGLLKIVVYYLGIFGVLGILRMVHAMITGWVGERIILDMRREVFAHVQKQSLAYFDKNPVGRLVTRVTSDVQTLSEIFSSGVVVIFGDMFILIGIIVAMLMLNWKLALISFMIVPFIVVVTFFFRSKLREAFRDVRLKTASLSSLLQEHFSGIRIVQLFSHEKTASEQCSKRSAELRKGHLQTVSLFSIFFPMLELLSAIAVALIIVRGGFLVLDDAVTLGVLVAFIQYTERFFRPIRELAEKWNIFQSGMASAERVFKLLDTKPGIQNNCKSLKPEIFKGSVAFKDVSFNYNGEDDVISDLDFSVKPGETIAIVGATGAGKSTIINLIGRFYDVTKGNILVDDIDVKDWDQEELLSNIAYVQQDVFLFSGTIKDNITLGDSFSDEQIQNAVETVHADRFVQKLENGLDDAVTERGSTFSSGQRQLLSFARAIIRDPKILILDEATSSVDPETERLIQDAMNRLVKGRTSFVVAHRLSTIQQADRIFVMHKGELKETGTHKDLLKKKGFYWRLFQMQYQRVA